VVGSSSRPSTPTSSSASPHQRASDHPQSSSRGQPSPAEAAGIIARLKDKRLARILMFFHDLLLWFYLSCIQHCLVFYIYYGIWIAIDILCYLCYKLYVFMIIHKLGHLAKLCLDLCHATSLDLIPWHSFRAWPFNLCYYVTDWHHTLGWTCARLENPWVYCIYVKARLND